MGNRLSLHNKLVELLGSSNVYYQPPSNVKLVYPCVLYNQNVGDSKKASNKLYTYKESYDITFIFRTSNDNIVNSMLTEFTYCSESRRYIAENLYHYTFTLYY